jgi:exosome complex RNA-binding protein Rrp42 (RNase PH superfamily)
MNADFDLCCNVAKSALQNLMNHLKKMFDEEKLKETPDFKVMEKLRIKNIEVMSAFRTINKLDWE